MKKILTTLFLIAVSHNVFADQPDLIVDGTFHVVYDEVVEISEIHTDVMAQFNHASPQTVDVVLSNNINVEDINVDVTLLGNNVDVTTVDDVGILQGNQVGGIGSVTSVVNNDIAGDINVNVTAVGNNANVVVLDDVSLGNVQFNKNSPILVDVSITDNNLGGSNQNGGSNGNSNGHGHSNGHGVGHNSHGNGHGYGHNNDVDVQVGSVELSNGPIVNVTAIGNNLSVEGLVGNISSLQLNRDSPITVNVGITGNVGTVGSLDTSITNVGNNLSVSVGDM